MPATPRAPLQKAIPNQPRHTSATPAEFTACSQMMRWQEEP